MRVRGQKYFSLVCLFSTLVYISSTLTDSSSTLVDFSSTLGNFSPSLGDFSPTLADISSALVDFSAICVDSRQHILIWLHILDLNLLSFMSSIQNNPSSVPRHTRSVSMIVAQSACLICTLDSMTSLAWYTCCT